LERSMAAREGTSAMSIWILFLKSSGTITAIDIYTIIKRTIKNFN